MSALGQKLLVISITSCDISRCRSSASEWPRHCFTAKALGWTSRDIFGLHEPPLNPHASYSRLSRLDAAGLVWVLMAARQRIIEQLR